MPPKNIDTDSAKKKAEASPKGDHSEERQPKLPFFVERFPRYAEIQRYCKMLARKYPAIMRVEKIGKSIQGRTIEVVIFQKDKYRPKKAVMVEAGIHAREWLAHTTALYFIKHLTENQQLLQFFDYFVIPCLNPDGYEYTHTVNRQWRKNLNMNGNWDEKFWGVDINRNFPHQHGLDIGSSGDIKDLKYRGPHYLSEPESKCLHEFVQRNSTAIKLYLAVHCYGSTIMYPWGWTETSLEDEDELRACAKAAVEAMKAVNNKCNYCVGSLSKTMYFSSGGSVDNAKGFHHVKFAYTVELPRGGRSGFDPAPEYIQKVAQEMMAGIKGMVDYVHEYYSNVQWRARNIEETRSENLKLAESLDRKLYWLQNRQGGRKDTTSLRSQPYAKVEEKRKSSADPNKKILDAIATVQEHVLYPRVDVTNKNGKILFFLQRFPRYCEIVNYCKVLSQKYSHLVRLESIGKSTQGRTIIALVVRKNWCFPKNAVFLEAGIHAREWLTHPTILYYITHVLENQDMLKNMDYYFVPCLNPDGYEYSHTWNRLWRKNMSTNGSHNPQSWGVDLNRNFPFQYGCDLGSSSDKTNGRYRGPHCLSEPESKSLHKFITKYRKYVKLYIAIHCQGLMILPPWGYTNEAPEDVDDLIACGQAGAAAVKKVNKATNFKVGQLSRTMHFSSGGCIDNVRGSHNIKFCYTIELHPGGPRGVDPPPTMIPRVTKEVLEGIKAMADYVHQYYQENKESNSSFFKKAFCIK